MPQPFSAHCFPIGELMSDRFQLTVPSYQRPYSWTTEQAGELLDDLLEASGQAEFDGPFGDSDYFLGAVVIMERDADGSEPYEPDDGGKVCEVVDGLQRIATLTILLAVIRDIAEDDDPEISELATRAITSAAGPRLTLQSAEQAFFKSHVVDVRATAAMPEADELTPPQSRMLAVREQLMDVLLDETAERRRALVLFVLGHCHVAVISARTIDRAHQIFSVINDRGLPLSSGDILKAEILGTLPEFERVAYQAKWQRLEEKLGGSLEELFSLVRQVEGRPRGRIIDAVRSLVAERGDVGAFIDSVLVPLGAILGEVRAAAKGTSTLPQEVSSLLVYLGWLGSHDWLPPLMLYWRNVGGHPARIAAFLGRLDRLAYGMRLLGIGSDKRAIRYRALMEAIRNGTIDEPGGAFDLTRDEQRLILYNLKSMHARSQIACKLVLLRLNDLVAGGPQRLDPSRLTVEHILPQKPSRTSEWRIWYPHADVRERSTQSLGNLVLVSREANEQARNLEFAKKQAIYFAPGTEQPAITQDIAGLTFWGPGDVSAREERLIGRLVDLWQLTNPRGGASDGRADADARPTRAGQIRA